MPKVCDRSKHLLEVGEGWDKESNGNFVSLRGTFCAVTYLKMMLAGKRYCTSYFQRCGFFLA